MQDGLVRPKLMHLIFYGSYDWHSSVYTHWLLVKILKDFSYFISKEEIFKALDTQFTKKANAELSYLIDPLRKGYKDLMVEFGF